jgi:chromosome partitioning protein
MLTLWSAPSGQALTGPCRAAQRLPLPRPRHPRRHDRRRDVAGILINQHEENTVSGRAWLDDLTEAAEARGLRVLTPPVPKRVVIADAVEASKGLDEWGSAEATALSGLYSGHLTTLEGVRA